MQRKKFIKTCCYTMLGIPIMGSIFQSCGGIHYATSSFAENRLTVSKSEFLEIKKNKTIKRDFVLVKTEAIPFPICLYKTEGDKHTAALLRCTHQGCELNVGGGIYSCPCHGSEFSIAGEVLTGPADRDLKIYKTETDHENIYIYLS